MARLITWNFYKLILQSERPFTERQKELQQRFEKADTFEKLFRKETYRYQFYDLTLLNKGKALTGYLTRSPKVAHGRVLDGGTRTSTEGTVNIQEIADSTEFIYDFDTCVFAVHRRAPFTSPKAVAEALRELLGLPFDTKNKRELDVHVEALRDDSFTEAIFESAEPLREVKLVFAKPNPPGDETLAAIHLGLIGEETNSDEINFDAKKKSGGSLDKDKDGFLRRSIRTLNGLGYLKDGFVRIGDKRIDLRRAKEKERQTDGYELDENGQPLSLEANATVWLSRLEREEDIYIQPGTFGQNRIEPPDDANTQ